MRNKLLIRLDSLKRQYTYDSLVEWRNKKSTTNTTTKKIYYLLYILAKGGWSSLLSITYKILQ